MDLHPLRDLIARHQLAVDPAHSVLDVSAELGTLARQLLRATAYGTRPLPDDALAQLREAVGNVTFAVAHLGLVLGVDAEDEMQRSITRFASKLEGQSGPQRSDAP